MAYCGVIPQSFPNRVNFMCVKIILILRLTKTFSYASRHCLVIPAVITVDSNFSEPLINRLLNKRQISAAVKSAPVMSWAEDTIQRNAWEGGSRRKESDDGAGGGGEGGRGHERGWGRVVIWDGRGRGFGQRGCVNYARCCGWGGRGGGIRVPQGSITRDMVGISGPVKSGLKGINGWNGKSGGGGWGGYENLRQGAEGNLKGGNSLDGNEGGKRGVTKCAPVGEDRRADETGVSAPGKWLDSLGLDPEAGLEGGNEERKGNSAGSDSRGDVGNGKNATEVNPTSNWIDTSLDKLAVLPENDSKYGSGNGGHAGDLRRAATGGEGKEGENVKEYVPTGGNRKQQYGAGDHWNGNAGVIAKKMAQE